MMRFCLLLVENQSMTPTTSWGCISSVVLKRADPAGVSAAATSSHPAVRGSAGRPPLSDGHRRRRAGQHLRRCLEGGRQAVLTAEQADSPSPRPYDLRHAAISLWLNAGVPATEVARRAGHGVAVLLAVYANCVDGEDDAVNERIEQALAGDPFACETRRRVQACVRVKRELRHMTGRLPTRRPPRQAKPLVRRARIVA